MTSTFKRLLYWLIPILIVGGMITGLLYFQQPIDEKRSSGQKTQEGMEKPRKGFAKPLPSTQQEVLTQSHHTFSEALNSGDISECANIEDEVLRKSCLDRLNFATSVKNDDPVNCEPIQDEVLKTLCYDKAYFSLGLINLDLAECQKIKDAVLKENCLDQINLALAKKSGKSQDCQEIRNAEVKKQCLDNYYIGQAAETRNSTSCSSLSSNPLQEQCQQAVNQNQRAAAASQQAAALKKTNVSLQEVLLLCNQLEQEAQEVCKNTVYPKLALEEKDLSHCDKISEKSLINDCKTQVGQQLDQHYLRAATSQKNQTLCGSIEDNTVRKFCLDQF